MKRIIFFVSLFVFLSFWFSFASTSWSLLVSLAQEKATIEASFDEAYSAVYQKFNSSVVWFLTSLNYQWLVCLWVINDTLFLQDMQNQMKNLKLWFLNTYTSLYGDAFDLEQKQRIYKDTSVVLFASWTTYDSEKQRIFSTLTALSTTQKNLATQFKSTYENKINTFVADYYDYAQKNKDILSSVWNNIQIIKQVDSTYKDLVSRLLQYQSQLAWSWTNFFSKLYLLKQTSLSWLDMSLQNIIDREVKKYRILPTLSTELLHQKNYALGLFDMQVDEKINLLLSKRYDNKEYTQLTKDVEKFLALYAPLWRPLCSKIQFSSSFTQEAAHLIASIQSFWKTFSSLTGTNQLSWFQKTVTTWFPVITTLQKDMIITFRTAVSQKEQQLLYEYRKNISDSWSSSVQQPLPEIQAPSSFKFSQPFKKWQKHDDVLILQQLLINLWYYSWAIDGVYSPETLQAVYQYQLSRNLLKWYEKKPQTWWWMGPSTRNQLNKDLAK